MATTYYNDIQKLYVAYFNRPADPTGLAYYEAALEQAGTDAKAIAAAKANISAGFAASAEYKANFTGMANADVVNTVYMNLFGRAADAAGQKYYADLLTAGKLTIDAVVTEVANGAQGADATAFANKVTASTAFTGALTAADSYNTQAAATAAKAFLSGVTDNASLAKAVDPTMLQVSIAKVDAAALPFSLQTGLTNLTAANAVKANFLDAADGKLDGKTSATAEADIGTAVGTKAGLVAAIVDANVTNAAEKGLYAASTTSAAVKAAVLAEAQTNLANTLAADQAKVSADNAAIAKVAGLGAAINALTAANTTLDTATKAQTAAHTDVAVKAAGYGVQNGGTPTIAADYSISGVIDVSKGTLVLHTGVTETTNPGVTALLNSLLAEKAADAAVVSATSAQGAASHAVDFLDLGVAAQADIQSIASAMTINKIPAGTLPTEAQISAETAGLLAIKTAADATASAPGATQAQIDAGTAADGAYSSFTALVSKLATDDTTNPLSAKLTADTGAVTADQKAVDALTKALADLSTATTAKAELDAVNGQVAAAQGVFTSHGLMQPLMLDTNTTAAATAGADIFVTGTKSATISGFDVNGADSLYIGSKFAALGTDLTKGNDAVLEAFVTTDASGNVVISVEQKAFASHEAAPAADLVQITLTGVTDVTKVHLNNGIITVS